jgi:membrane dipeptidase
MTESSINFPIVDGHLDLAENATIFGRNLRQDIYRIRESESRSNNQATGTLPELRSGGIAVAIATVTPGILLEDVESDFSPKSAIYSTPQEAEAQAIAQIKLYEDWERNDEVRIIKSVNDLEDHLQLWVEDRKTGLVLLMEGADPVVEIKDLSGWWWRGLRIIGLTFGDTKYGKGVAGGTISEKQGGLTEAGFELLHSMAGIGFTWDISHLTERGIWEGMELNFPRICASHANARALTPSNRHLSDSVIKAVAERRGL